MRFQEDFYQEGGQHYKSHSCDKFNKEQDIEEELEKDTKNSLVFSISSAGLILLLVIGIITKVSLNSSNYIPSGITVAIKVSVPNTYDNAVKTLVKANPKETEIVVSTQKTTREAAKDFEIFHVNHVEEDVEVIGISCCPKIM